MGYEPQSTNFFQERENFGAKGQSGVYSQESAVCGLK